MIFAFTVEAREIFLINVSAVVSEIRHAYELILLNLFHGFAVVDGISIARRVAAEYGKRRETSYRRCFSLVLGKGERKKSF